jgi:Phospholipase_D-nuclease N-terminal
MLRVLFYAIPIVATIYAIVDCLQTPDNEIRGLPRFAWLVLIVFFPIIGSVVWLLAGRARGGAEHPRIAWPAAAGSGPHEQPRPARRVVAPDDDPEFLSQLGRSNSGRRNSEQDALLEQWEQDLRRREADQRGDDSKPAPGDGPSDEPGPQAGGSTPRA